MRKIIKSKISAAVLTVAILFTTVFSVSIFASAASNYTPRLSAPSTSNKYYYSDLNLFYKFGYGMPNCTAYAYGRAYELLKTEPKLCRYDAEQWYGYNKSNNCYKYGTTPKLGAIACWAYNGGGGHVAVVEKIENGTITLSNSAYGGTNFYLTTASTTDKNVGGQSWWNFQGYIYIGDFESQPTTSKTYQLGVYQTKVDDYLNMRSGAGTSYGVVTSIPDGVKLTVTKVNGSWGYVTYTGKSGWISLDYCNYVSEIPTVTTQPPTEKPTETTAPTQPTTAPEEHIVGDINGDGRLSITDVTIVQKYLSCDYNLTQFQLSIADVNGDGKISIADVTEMQKRIIA